MEQLTLEKLQDDVLKIKEELREIKLYVKEDFELSSWAKKELKKTRTEPTTISHKKVMKRYAT